MTFWKIVGIAGLVLGGCSKEMPPPPPEIAVTFEKESRQIEGFVVWSTYHFIKVVSRDTLPIVIEQVKVNARYIPVSYCYAQVRNNAVKSILDSAMEIHPGYSRDSGVANPGYVSYTFNTYAFSLEDRRLLLRVIPPPRCRVPIQDTLRMGDSFKFYLNNLAREDSISQVFSGNLILVEIKTDRGIVKTRLDRVKE